MGPPARFSALSALIAHHREPIERAMGECRERAWTAAGAASESRPPKAHVTLSRPDRRTSDRERRAGLAWASTLAIEPVAILLDRVALYTWSDERHRRDAPMFRRVREAPLADHSDPSDRSPASA